MSIGLKVRVGMELRGATAGEASMFKEMLRDSLDILSTLQLTRYTLEGISRMASGKAGLGELLSTATNFILITFRLNQLLGEAIGKQGTLNALAAAGPQGKVAGGGAVSPFRPNINEFFAFISASASFPAFAAFLAGATALVVILALRELGLAQDREERKQQDLRDQAWKSVIGK